MPLSWGSLPIAFPGPGAGVLRIDAEALQNRHDDPLVLFEQGKEEMGRGDLGIGPLGREPLCRCDGLLGLDW